MRTFLRCVEAGLVKEQFYTIPRTTEDIGCFNFFQGNQWVSFYGFVIQREFYRADFLSQLNRSYQGLFIFHGGFQFVRLTFGQRKINIPVKSSFQLILSAFPQMDRGERIVLLV